MRASVDTGFAQLEETPRFELWIGEGLDAVVRRRRAYAYALKPVKKVGLPVGTCIDTHALVERLAVLVA